MKIQILEYSIVNKDRILHTETVNKLIDITELDEYKKLIKKDYTERLNIGLDVYCNFKIIEKK